MLENLSNFGRYFTVRPFLLLKIVHGSFPAQAHFYGCGHAHGSPHENFLKIF